MAAATNRVSRASRHLSCFSQACVGQHTATEGAAEAWRVHPMCDKGALKRWQHVASLIQR